MKGNRSGALSLILWSQRRMRNRRARSRRYMVIGVTSERRPESKHAYERRIWDEDRSWARRRTKDSCADLKRKANRRSEVATRRSWISERKVDSC